MNASDDFQEKQQMNFDELDDSMLRVSVINKVLFLLLLAADPPKRGHPLGFIENLAGSLIDDLSRERDSALQMRSILKNVIQKYGFQAVVETLNDEQSIAVKQLVSVSAAQAMANARK